MTKFNDITNLNCPDTIRWEQNMNQIELDNETIVFCRAEFVS